MVTLKSVVNEVKLCYTLCPGSSDPFYVVTYYINGDTISWTYSTKKTHFVYTLFRYAGDVFNNAQNYIDQSFSRGEHFGNPRLVFPWYLYKMVTQNMLRTHNGK